MTRQPDITFARLPEIALDDIVAHMSDPRVFDHLPLAVGVWDRKACAAFVQTKEDRWRRDGLGHWAIICDGCYAGWGGFQKEGKEWDFGLVLRPDRFGLGIRIAKLALTFAFADPRIAFVTFLVPPSRKNRGGLERLGARYVGDVDHGGKTFLKYRLATK